MLPQPLSGIFYFMQNILKAAEQAVKQAKSMIDYYQKEVTSKQESLERAKKEAEILEKEYQELLTKVNPQD